MRTLILALFAVAISSAASALADTDIPQVSMTKATGESSSLDQLITLQAGELEAQQLRISNGAYGFNYDGAHAFYGEAGWAVRLLGGKGALYFEENLGFTTFDGNVAAGATGSALSNSYSLYVFAFDTRLMYAADWFPVRWIVPFVDGGYQYNVYFQPASADDQSVQGGSGFPVAGAGLRLWLNPKSSVAEGGLPVFISLKYNHLFTSASALEFDPDSFLAGVTLGL